MTEEEIKPYIIKTITKEYTRANAERKGQKNRVKFYILKCVTPECTNSCKVQRSKLKRYKGKCNQCASKKKPFEWAYTKILKRNQKDKRFENCHISYEEALEIMSIPNCAYCGVHLQRNKHHLCDTNNPLLLDRKDSSKGYTANNVVPCCWPCNEMKRDFYTFDEFKAIMNLLMTSFGWEPTLQAFFSNRGGRVNGKSLPKKKKLRGDYHLDSHIPQKRQNQPI